MAQEFETGSFHRMKSLNKSTILNVIRLQGPISRAEIAKLTKLTPPTVTNIVGELLESGLVVESELGESSGGRKPIMLRIDSSRYTVIGIYAGAKRVRGIMSTLDGQVVLHGEERIPAEPDAQTFLGILHRVIRQMIEQTDPAIHTVLGIGIGMHGLVDPHQGISIFAPNLNLRNLHVKESVEKEFALPVEVENDVRALALGESWFGQGKGLANFICINVGTGVGAGIYLEGKLFQGASYTAGEMGHTTIDVHGPKCSCGNYGCLEAIVSGPAIALRAKQAIAEGRETLLAQWQKSGETISGELVYRAARRGDELSRELLARTGEYLGVGLANLINTLNPSRIIVSGGVSKAGELVLEPLQKTVAARSLQSSAEAVTIVTSQLGEHAMAIGAVTLFLEKMFTPAGAAEIS
ncbi:MAG TPA: ROK family transcriptional regulator [Candidatus Bathyarchaeia archaeon]|nr:ROK family transcriptional regulator [Candidatus Bathyarchaeia archaeon]